MEQPDFSYRSCPECDFDAVVLADTPPTYCPICAGDKGDDVRMTSRKAYDTDIPEGLDERKTPEKPLFTGP